MKNKFAEIKCGGTTKKGFRCTEYLGHIQFDVDNTAYFYCRRCHRSKEMKVRDGVITERILKQWERIFTPESPVLKK